jgi:hypothetical protein|nr:MAG TPA: helix-turn-helix domain protein [Caudoviricetes sp.]
MKAAEAARSLLESLEAMEQELEELKAWKRTVNLYPEIPPIMTAEDFSKAFHCSVTSAYEIFKRGCLPVIKTGGMVRVTKEAFLKWAANGGDHEKIKKA